MRRLAAAMAGWFAAAVLATTGCSRATDETQDARRLLLASFPRPADASVLNDLGAEELFLGAPVVVSGVTKTVTGPNGDLSLSLLVDRVVRASRPHRAIAPGDSLAIEGPLGIELPRGVRVWAALRFASDGTIWPMWPTSFVGVPAPSTISFADTRQRVTAYSLRDPRNFFGCATSRSETACREVRLAAYGVKGRRRLTAFDRLVARDAYGALLWFELYRRRREPFPARLCRDARERSCASVEAFTEALDLHGTD